MTDDEPEFETPELRERLALQAAAHQARLAERRAPQRDRRDERTPDGPAA